MPRWNETPEFLRLQRQWYARAMVAGHVDVENWKDTDSSMFLTHPEGERAASTHDLALAMQVADRAREEVDHPERFTDARERAIWTLATHAGMSPMEIAGVLGTSRHPVDDAIHRVKARMVGKPLPPPIRPWKPRRPEPGTLPGQLDLFGGRRG